MKLFLLTLALMVVAMFYFVERTLAIVSTGAASFKMVIIVKDQELWVEGFIRKLFSRLKDLPQVKVLVVDDNSSDHTPQILGRLQNRYHFEFLSASETGVAGEPENTNVVIRFDVRDLMGKELLRSPLFYHLSCLNSR